MGVVCRSLAGVLAGLCVLAPGLVWGQIKPRIRVVAQTCTGTTITTSDDLATLAAAAAVNTTFCLQAGVHRATTITPKQDQKFVSVRGAVLSGATLLTGWVGSSAPWYVTGQTQAGASVGTCVTGFPRCNLPEDVYRDNVVLIPVAVLGDGAPGKFFFDYAADRIYVWDDPNGHTVETGTTTTAFTGSASGVVIRGLTIEKYANPAQAGAIAGTGTGWIVEGNDVRFNHGGGIGMAGTRIVRYNRVHHNGQMGVLGTGNGALVLLNEIDHNNTLGFDSYWEAGGTKFTFSTGLTVSWNYAHHNKGPGLWTDADNTGILFEYNTVTDNDDAGIMHEISYSCVIRYNTVLRNGVAWGATFWVDGAGILVSDSTDVEVYGNVVTDNVQAIMAIDMNRPGGYSLQNLSVHDNIITSINTGAEGTGRSGIGAVDPTDPYTIQGNSFEHNTYFLGSLTNYFTWLGNDRTKAQWIAYGNDDTGTFTP